MKKLDGKIAIITGAADGIGAAAAQALAREGATAVVTDINLDAAQKLAATLGNGAIALALDVCDENAWKATIDTVVARFGKLDILVNNAGGGGAGTIEDTSLEQYRNGIRLNLDSVFIGCQLAIAAMKTTGGNIINVSSIHGIRAGAHAATYSAAKGAVRLLSKSIALHCAQHGYQIRCNSIHPGYILTTQMCNWLEGMPDPESAKAGLVAQHPIGFLGDPRDIANGILFLASDDSRFMTGAELVMDGGFSLI